MFESLKYGLQFGANIPKAIYQLAQFYFTSPKSLDSLSGIRLRVDSPMEMYRKAKDLAAGKQCPLNSMVVPTFAMKWNAFSMKPILAAGLDGDKGMQKHYDRERLVTFDSFPKWVKERCSSLIVEELQRFRLSDYLPGSMRGQGAQLSGPAFNKKMVLEQMLFDYFLTTHDRAFFLAEAQSHHFSGRISAGHQLTISPVGRDPLANQARLAFKKAHGFLHATRIILDFGSLIGVEMKPKFVEDMALSYRDKPWQVSNDACFARLFLASDTLNARVPRPSAQVRNELLQRCLYTDPHSVLPELAEKRVAATATPPRSDSVPVAENTDQVRETPTVLKNAIVEALLEQMRVSGGDTNRETARQLHRAIKRGALDLSETLTALNRGIDALELLASASLEEKPSLREERKSKPEAPTNELSETSSFPERQTGFTVIREAPFEDWLNSLVDRSTIARVERRIDRLIAGNMGDSKTVRGGVIELREGALRIYLRKTGPAEFRVKLGGFKATQDADIDACQDL